MGEMASFLGYQQSNEMELGQKLVHTTLELEKVKAEAMEQMQKNKEYITKLIFLLNQAIRERDEALNNFHNLLNKTNDVVVPLFHPNSSITESNSLSDPYNHISSSSPVDSLFDAVSSPDFNLIPNQPNVDQESLIIDTLAKGRVLPQKGKFLKAVIQAGPLLEQLMVAGPLPRWRNPPQMQPFQIPPVSIKGCQDSPTSTSFVSQSFAESAAPMLNFGGGNASTFMNNVTSYSPLPKRHRFA